MASEHFDEITEIRLPARILRRSVGIAFDVGGSRCKVAFKKRTENCKSSCHDEQQVTLVLAGFSRHRLTEALDFVKRNADYTLERRDDGVARQLRITGVFYSPAFASTVETQLNLSSGGAVYANEFDLEANAISVLEKNLAENELFYSAPPSPWKTSEAEDSGKCCEAGQQQSINGKTSTALKPAGDVTSCHVMPYLIVCYGSATGITLVSKDGKSSLINGSGEGGVSLLAMSKLLTGTDNFAEFMALAERGSMSEVSTTAEECQQEPNEANYFDNFPPDAVVHTFGKVLKPDFKAKPEDMARALLMNAVQNVASITVWTALAKNCRTVYICGGVFEHKLPRDLFFYFFEGLAGYFGQTTMKCRALKYSSFVPVLGAILDESTSS